MAIKRRNNKKTRAPSGGYVYSSYYARHPAEEPKPPELASSPRRRTALWPAIIVVLVLGLASAWAYQHYVNKAPALASHKPVAVNYCAANQSGQLILVSISRQHMWACDGSAQVYDNPVVTGMEMYPADLTPTGTYKIYDKQTDLTLSGSDSTGSWSDPVSYWLPFLNNQYGTYGFHDATWRAPGDFGHVNINAPYTAAKPGSHGCVEMPLAAAKWLYGWAQVGTTVTIES